MISRKGEAREEKEMFSSTILETKRGLYIAQKVEIGVVRTGKKKKAILVGGNALKQRGERLSRVVGSIIGQKKHHKGERP